MKNVFRVRNMWAILGCLFLLACSISPTWAADTFKIAQFDPMSGPLKRTGDGAATTIQLVVDEINQKGGILGKKVELIVEDNQGKPDITVRKATKSIMDGVKVLIVGQGSNNAAALAQLAEKEKVIVIAFSAEAASLTGKDCNRYFFRVSPNTEMRAMAMAAFFATKPYKRFAMINQDYSFGHESAEGFKRRLLKAVPGAQIVADEFHPIGNKDFGPYINKIAAAKPEVIFSANFGADLANLVKQARELGLKQPFMGFYLASPTDVLPQVGNGALGSWNCDGFFETIKSPSAKNLVQRWKACPKCLELEKTPTAVYGRMYNGMETFFEAIKRANSFDVEKIINAWEGLKMEGATGTVMMRKEDHQLLMPLYVAQIVAKNEFYPFPYFAEPMMFPLEKTTVPLAETGCSMR